MDIITRTYNSPCGEMLIGVYDGKLCLCEWLSGKSNDAIHRRICRELKSAMVDDDGLTPESKVLDECSRQLDEYFRGERTDFSLPLLTVGTEFQKRVWSELMKVPYATPLSYGELAQRIGMPSAVRAVANANGANAISIFIPCHRIIGTDRSLTGYGGGLPAKRHLLDVERIAYREQ